MKINRSPYSPRRRRSPLFLPILILLVLLAAFLVWAWLQGGPQPQSQVEKVIPAERLGR